MVRVIAAIQITSDRWRSYLPPKTEIGLHRPFFHSVVIRITRLAYIRAAFLPHGSAEWLARVDCSR